MAGKLFIALVVLIILVSIAVYLGKRKKEKFDEDQAENIMLKFPAKRGDKGEHIMVIQAWANTQLNPPMAQLDVDGKWGGLTDTAINFITGKTIVTYPEYLNIV